MKPDQVIKHFGGQVAAAAAIGVQQPTVCNWRKLGEVPKVQQMRIQAITNGALKADKATLKHFGRL